MDVTEQVIRAPGPATRRARRAFAPLLWIGPALALIGLVVLAPVVVMVGTSLQRISPDGFVLGPAGLRNFTDLFDEDDLPAVLARTVLWVVVVVVVTMAAAMVLAQLFNATWPGRRAARWALIAPWAASVTMTALIFRWALDANNGVVNVFLHDIGLLDSYNSDRSDWLGRPWSAMAWMMIVAVFVSVPFSTYALLAGLQAIPTEIYEAARTDGATRGQIYRLITLPLLRPAFLVAALINIINVFNSFPIIWEMTRGGPGNKTSTTTTFMFTLKQSYIGESAALSIINFALVIVLVLLFLRASRWREQVN